MVVKGPAVPPHWSSDELQAARETSRQRFVDLRLKEGPREFQRIQLEVAAELERALVATEDLLRLDAQVFVNDPTAWGIFRYFCAPPVSEEDFWTFVGSIFTRVPPEAAERVAEVLRTAIDPWRFPWYEEQRAPTAIERRVAVAATTTLLARERLQTERRSSYSVQESLVAEELIAAGFERDYGRMPIRFIDDLERGRFSRERKVAGAKCDVPVRLRCGRLLAMECKISNGPKNSWKRLNAEIGGKAEKWRTHFGHGGVITAAVLAGLYDLSALVSAQNGGVVIFWEHDLQPLRAFLLAGAP